MQKKIRIFITETAMKDRTNEHARHCTSILFIYTYLLSLNRYTLSVFVICYAKSVNQVNIPTIQLLNAYYILGVNIFVAYTTSRANLYL